MTTTAVPTITTNQIKAGELPDDVTGVMWMDSGWTECRDHLLDPSWAMQITGDDQPSGVALFATDTFECDACGEA